jgi:glycosyltransferase involved in cell wall biosynthesis
MCPAPHNLNAPLAVDLAAARTALAGLQVSAISDACNLRAERSHLNGGREMYPYQYTFTVFTPTFNRRHTLHRVYESLSMQTFRDFEWLIVDDGSVDNTWESVEVWQQYSDFPIRYIWQQHQGKHIAFNRGVQEARGELFLDIDSDDACIPEALARFKYHWDSIPNNEKDQFSAVTALCKDQHGKIVGSSFPQSIIDSNSLEMYYKYKMKGDKWGFHRTEVLRNFQFPAVKGVDFVPESLVWHAIARQFRTRFVNEPLLICFRNEQGRSDHLSSFRKPSTQALSYRLSHQTVLNEEIAYFRYRPQQAILSPFQYIRYSYHAGISFVRQIRELSNFRARILWSILLPCGLLGYVIDKTLGR